MVKLNISGVQLTCSVEWCTNVEDGMLLDRHHVRSQKMWITIFRDKSPALEYREFVQRYYEFHPDDICRLCREHHEEVHDLYWNVVEKHKRKLGIPLYWMTWKQAEIIMADLEKTFWAWLKRKNQQKGKSLFRTLKRGKNANPSK
jgi:hypothetical protein